MKRIINEIVDEIRILSLDSPFKNIDGTLDINFFYERGPLRENFNIIKDHCEVFVRRKRFVEIEEYVLNEELFRNCFDSAVRQFRATQTVSIPDALGLAAENLNRWLTTDRQKSCNWNNGSLFSYRSRYFAYLLSLGRSQSIVESLNKSTLRILGKFGDPTGVESFFRKGMVVGSVQSGKTENFNAVINSAIDLGYKCIIVLSGITEDLRVQTQRRIEKDIIGRFLRHEFDNFSNRRAIYSGVGAIQPFTPDIFRDENVNNVEIVSPITSVDSDFSEAIARGNHNIGNLNIFVVKKNASILNNILIWCSQFVENDEQINFPLLIIDDEADNASLNNMGHKGADIATKINKQIRAILGLFSKKTYLGYTATPFANVLQDRNMGAVASYNFSRRGTPYEFRLVDNLYPEHFIEMLFPPSNYIGIKHFFQTKKTESIKIDPLIAPVISENELLLSFPKRINKLTGEGTTEIVGSRSPRPNDNFPIEIPQSLDEAIKSFIITIAIRTKRQNLLRNTNLSQKHHSMLIHISRFSAWQNRTKSLIYNNNNYPNEGVLNRIIRQLDNGDQNAEIFREFRRVWNKHYDYIVQNIHEYLDDLNIADPYLAQVSFEDIMPELGRAASGIEVKAINSSNEASEDKLDYNSNTSKKYIVIGGNRLSRGFTLEGLTINYFLRGTDNADTLLQMGRWFGYRPGYLDCCKLFTTQENVNKFDEVSYIIEDLEYKFRELVERNRSPKDFTIWIKNNPDVIKLTRGNFLRGVYNLTLDFSDHVQQATKFKIDRTLIDRSGRAFFNLVNNLEWQFSENQSFLIHNTDAEGFKRFINIESTMLNLNILGLDGYLEKCGELGLLENWIVGIKNIRMVGEARTLDGNISGLGHDIKLTKRTGPSRVNTNSWDSLMNDQIFNIRNSSLISADDFKIALSDNEITEAIEDFRNHKKREIQHEKPNLSNAQIEELASRVAIPDKAYRAKMNNNTGVLIIYPLDIKSMFSCKEDLHEDNALLQAKFNELNLTECQYPIFGYAIGFPTDLGIEAEEFITQHLGIEDMNLAQLRAFVINNDEFDIDLELDWTRDTLRDVILDQLSGVEFDEALDQD